MLLYRITHKKVSSSLFAPGIEGRWNSAGRKVIYASESVSLAFLESMIRRKGAGFNDDFRTLIIEVPDSTKTTNMDVSDLPIDWRSFQDYSRCQLIGDSWYQENKTLLLKVPSAVLPDEHNYVINTQHREFDQVKLLKTIELVPDERIEDILRKYRK